MSDRQPLPGWTMEDHGGFTHWSLPISGRVRLTVSKAPGSRAWWGVVVPVDGHRADAVAAQLAAEDAARALLAEMAGALGVRLAPEPCRWTDGDAGTMRSACGSDFDGADTWMTYCPGCGGPVEAVEGGSDG